METTDGRRRRSQRTRAAVAEAVLDCFEEGVLRPSAKQVAERAGVSTRAVFRHFDNMEALLEQAADFQIERIGSQLPPLVFEGPLDRRLGALVEHSARRNELTTPVRRAALLSEPFSRVIRERHAWMRGAARKQVRAVFSEELEPLSEAACRDKVAAIRALLSFSYWDELRRHSKLSATSATRVSLGAVRAVLTSE